MATASEKRSKAVTIAEKRLKLNSYTQGSKRVYVGGYPSAGTGVRGYSDCSSFVRWVLKKAGGFDIGGNTDAQIANRKKGVLIEKAEPDQTYPTERLLLPGDCIYWKGTPSHTWGVGHVEMYIGDGKCIGHGSGIGPTVKTLKTYSKNRGSGARKYLCVIRWIRDEPEKTLGVSLLQLGDEGPMVAALQTLLKKLGYNLGEWGADGDGIDGEYGSDTKKAVRRFEADHGLTQDGIADIACIHALMIAGGESIGRVRVTGETVYVRSGPNTDNRPIGLVRKGDVLEMAGNDTEDWRGVFYKNNAAYISEKYVEAVK